MKEEVDVQSSYNRGASPDKREYGEENHRHPPVCINYKSEIGCSYGKRCQNRHVDAEEKPSKKSGVSQDSDSKKSVLRNRVHVTQEEKQTCLESQKIKSTNSECMQTVFRNVTNRVGNNKDVSQMAMKQTKPTSRYGHCLWHHRCKQHCI